MEVFGVIAGAAQISGNILGIISTIQDVRHQISDGPLQSKERIEYLDLLCATVREVENNTNLHTNKVAGYLAGIQAKILRLQTIVAEQLSKLHSGTYQKLRFAFTVLKVEKRVSETFAELHRDSSALTLYLSVSGISPAPTTAQHPRVRAVQDGGMPTEANTSARRQPEVEHPPSEETAENAPESNHNVNQKYGAMKVSGTGSKNTVGNVRSPGSLGIQQDFGEVDVEGGAVNEAGNLTFGQKQGTDGKKSCNVS